VVLPAQDWREARPRSRLVSCSLCTSILRIGGAGVGRRLIAAARRRLTRLGRSEAILWVLRGNRRAEGFYRTDGWALDGVRRTDEVWGVLVDEVRYRRALP
jgi:hypothetical protein